MPLISRRRVVGEKVMISEVRLSAGFSVPTHAHENEQIAMVMSGRMRFTLHEGTREERVVELTGGQALELPANLPHAAEALEDTLIYDVFAPPSEKTGVDRE